MRAMTRQKSAMVHSAISGQRPREGGAAKGGSPRRNSTAANPSRPTTLHHKESALSTVTAATARPTPVANPAN
jgi:hypothetical protein